MNRGLEVADRSGQAWSIFKAKNIRQWSGFASFPTPPFQFTHISNLTSLTFDFSSNPVFFFNLQFRLSLQKFWLTATVEALVLILVPISKAIFFPPNYASAQPYFQFPNSISNLNRARAICHLRCPKLLPRPNINPATNQCLAMKQLMPANIYKRKYDLGPFFRNCKYLDVILHPRRDNLNRIWQPKDDTL